ncbi:helix-turn-helix transcriptional regulator [Pseudohalocynthiibacter aestuariivivens]|uniref:Helix-turn-helix transcriptional regulator n=1 Tax=Pseudohalocynthiibacter aestuariivivens TaxID=1591409 RepID=A0ABV5JDF3_9RHOB|nr:helix-turn-helix transcriptional regulator [Pseudohalocynthiibacter aestuariivivens]MBS9719057.1 helix-turn-helix domain-containing protein [Pseudohalocynthiibacter aestuariivivens]
MQFVHGVFIAPALKALNRENANTNDLFAQSGLDVFNMRDLGICLPLSRVAAFFDAVRSRMGHEMWLEIVRSYRMNNIPGWGDAIMGMPDLLSAVHLSTKPESSILSNETIVLNVSGPKSIFVDSFHHVDQQTRNWQSEFSLLLALDGFRAACGDAWAPIEIDLVSKDESILDSIRGLDNTTIRTGQLANRLVFETVDLATRMSGAYVDPTHIAPTMDGRMYALLDSIEPETKISVQLLADSFDLSPRTLQRRLADEGTTYFEIFDHWRMVVAIGLLDDPTVSVNEIAARLHYSNSAHFTRAFLRWTGMTTSAYRYGQSKG